jgi:hypothetical protein
MKDMTEIGLLIIMFQLNDLNVNVKFLLMMLRIYCFISLVVNEKCMGFCDLLWQNHTLLCYKQDTKL